MFTFFKTKLKKISFSLADKIRSLFKEKGKLSEDLEKILYEADLGPKIVNDLISKVEKKGLKEADEVIQFLKDEFTSYFNPILPSNLNKPHIIMIVGVNGSGKTTSAAKLAHRYQKEGQKTLLIAADTFRAAAVEQLELWAKVGSIDLVKADSKKDPSSVVYDGLIKAEKTDKSVVIIDTAGRLHTKTDLMRELEKMYRVTKKVVSSAPHEILFILDATTGQNGMDQLTTFKEFIPITGIVVTKLDSAAKAGVIIQIQKELKLPIKWIGIGEKIEEIEPFDVHSFVEELFMV